MALSPREIREIKQRFAVLREDHRKGDCYEMIATEFGVHTSTVAKLGKEVETNGQPSRTPEAITSSDFEIAPAPIRTAAIPKANHLLDDTGKYELHNNERWLILPDTQVPHHDQRTVDAVLKYAKQNYYDGCIQLGDFMDWDFCSRWTADNARKAEGQRFLSEYIHGNDVLDQIQDAVRTQNKDCHLIVIEGNHDWRIQNVIDKTPFLEGLIDVEKNLRFEERNAVFWRYWVHKKPITIGKAYFIHGRYIGSNHAKKTADSYGRSVFYGHTHDRMGHTKTTLASESVYCESLGTLSVFDLEYMGKAPSNWMQCFAEFYFHPNGNFNHYVTNIIDHGFIAIDGKQYQG